MLYHQKSLLSYFNRANSNIGLISRPLYTVKSTNQSLINTNRDLKIDLKNKYSFFNGIEYRKNLLRKFSRINNIKLYKKHFFKTAEFKLNKAYTLTKLQSTVSSFKNLQAVAIKDLLIKRIRFKPGYQNQ